MLNSKFHVLQGNWSFNSRHLLISFMTLNERSNIKPQSAENIVIHYP